MARLISALLLINISALADYWVDSGRTSNGDGSQANPWKQLSDINWTTVSNALPSGAVNLYLSSRSTWTQIQDWNILAHHASNILYIKGDNQFNTNATGTASWTPESTGSIATMTNGTGSGGGGPVIQNNRSNIWMQGLFIRHPAFGGILMGTGNPATNISNITITNCVIDTPSNNQGIWLGFGESGCHDITISHCVLSNVPLESVYLGHFSYLSDTITNILVENTYILNCGQGSANSQGEIDIKPGCYGAIVRYNIVTNSLPFVQGGNCGAVIGANNCQIYGNVFANARHQQDASWGNGLFVEADGDGLGNGKAITSCLIYNNLIYGCTNGGISFVATTSTAGANIGGVNLWNNTIVSNTTYGVYISASGSRSVTISQMTNNILGANGTVDIFTQNSSSTITAADYNLYFRASGNSWTVSNVSKTWAQWQALGYDAHGIQNSDPLFTSSTDYSLKGGSPAINAGVAIASFNTDILGNTRPQGIAWDIGAYEFTNYPTFNVNVNRANIGRIIAAP